MSARKLLFHILLHEIRHWAQIALRGQDRRLRAARRARPRLQQSATLNLEDGYELIASRQ